MQWMSTSRTARVLDREIGDLQHDLIAPAPLITYLRYNGDLGIDAGERAASERSTMRRSSLSPKWMRRKT